MARDHNRLSKLERAQKRVGDIKKFYQHLTVYIIVNSLLLIFSGKVTFVLVSSEVLGNPEIMEWINWNVWGTPLLWGIGLLIHAVHTFRPNPFKKWEERQIQKYMEQGGNGTTKYI